jgi:hypothetical protein
MNNKQIVAFEKFKEKVEKRRKFNAKLSAYTSKTCKIYVKASENETDHREKTSELIVKTARQAKKRFGLSTSDFLNQIHTNDNEQYPDPTEQRGE